MAGVSHSKRSLAIFAEVGYVDAMVRNSCKRCAEVYVIGTHITKTYRCSLLNLVVRPMSVCDQFFPRDGLEESSEPGFLKARGKDPLDDIVRSQSGDLFP